MSNSKLPENVILEGDNVQGMKTLPDACIPLTIASPPYDDLRTPWVGTWNFQAVANELYRITMPGGVVVWVVGEGVVDGSETGESSRQRLYFRDVGFRLHHTMVMGRTSGYQHSQLRYGRTLEYAFILSKGKPRYFNPLRDKKNKHSGESRYMHNRNKDGTMKTDKRKWQTNAYGIRGAVWFYHTGLHHTAKEDYAFKHPAMMPEKMAEDFILSWSRVNDLVFNPFMGSGTTAKMAVLNHRRFLGFELSPEYVEMARRRAREAQELQQKRLHR